MRFVRYSATLVLLLVFSSGCSNWAGSKSPAVVKDSELTQTQRFSLVNSNNESVTLEEVLSKNKVVLINFWATWCTFCVEEMPDLIRLQDKYQARGFTILGVNEGESAQEVSAFVKEMGLNFPVALDSDGAVARNYGVVGIPISYLINSAGKVLGEYHGFTSQLTSDVEQAI